jgi:hypothetical protein
MVLSLFTVSVIAGHPSQQEQKTPTELVARANHNSLKQAIYYQLSGIRRATCKYLKPDLLNQVYRISYLNQLVKVQFDLLSVQFPLFKAHFQFQLPQTILHYSDGESHSFLLG